MRYSDMPPFTVIYPKAGEAYKLGESTFLLLRDDLAFKDMEEWVLLQESGGSNSRLAYERSFFEKTFAGCRAPDLDSPQKGAVEIRGADCNSLYAEQPSQRKFRVIGDFRAPSIGCTLIAHESKDESGVVRRGLEKESEFFGRSDSGTYKMELRLRG